MKRFTKFLFLLCFWLQGNRAAFFSGGCNSTVGHSLCSQLQQQARMQTPAVENQPQCISAAADLPGENDLLLFEEEDKEDGHTRKLKTPTEPGSLFFSTLTLSHYGAIPTGVSPFFNYTSYAGNCKYIAICVWRI